MVSLGRAADESMEDVFLQHDLRPTIAEHATQCRSLFHKYVVMPEIVPDPTIMDDQLARFSLWASNMDVYGSPNVSLDYRLRFSPIAADIIHQLLDVIYDTLLSYGNSGATRRADDDTSDSESDIDPAEENVLKITETIGGTLTRLFRLSNAVRKSAKANRARKIETYRDDEEANKAIDELRLYTRCYIKFRFPETPEVLRSALVEANALRLRRLFYQRSHRRRIDLSTQSPEMTPVVVQLPKMTGSASTIRFASSALPKPARTNKMPAPSLAPATNATTARQTALVDLYAKSTTVTEVPRSKSVLVNSKLSFPPIPPTQQCPYCGVIVEFKNTASSLKRWQNHVIGDLEPYICVFSHCLEVDNHGYGTSPLTFETSKAWSSHIQTAHGHTWECRAPSHDPIVFDQEIQYQEHSIKEHGVPEAYARTLSNASRRPVLDKVLECPFGDDFQPSGRAESSTVFSSEALQSHVAGHMKEIALLTLQKLPSDDDENAENVDSDQPLEDDGPVGPFGITRASMYSVLDDEDLNFQDDDTEDADGKVGHREEDISARCLLEDHRIRSTATQQDNHGWSVLHLAIHSRDLTIVRILLDESVIAEPQTLLDESGLTAEDWLDRGPTSHSQKATGNLAFNKSRCCRAVTSLRQAVTTGNVPMIKLLLKLGHDINSMNSGRRTALYYAAKKGMLSIMNLLLDLGADPNILPAGRKNWEEFIPPGDVLLRLNQAGYWKRDTNPEVERQIRQALRLQSQPSVPDQRAWSVTDESTLLVAEQSISYGPNRPFSFVPVSSTPPSPHHAASGQPTRSLAPTHQTNDNKRKASRFDTVDSKLADRETSEQG
ncbi:ankyrin repeat domain-containing protein [Aspergillus stella-maris]|uniref:ankyrin repeat domain-containing protein n=1 Tax=Aspergillus stella-maris TaxID=1810926 RepID=UPI003CCDAE53